ncbi:Oligoribonuclease, mitochondrial [Nowakowskiella sp. JEL0078]|nr:Oligoribonuclease, mitochondrial [Nowakowskiella sp. JEL0078]
MTGLDPFKDFIIEISVVLSDMLLTEFVFGPSLVIHKNSDVLSEMNEWCIDQHGKSGLTEAVLSSNLSISDAETQILEFLKVNVVKGMGILAGNSIHMDKMFMMREMPSVIEFLSYRIVDVSTMKELTRAWYPEVFRNAPVKSGTHRYIQDLFSWWPEN